VPSPKPDGSHPADKNNSMAKVPGALSSVPSIFVLLPCVKALVRTG
jgi:hypothetical protein